MNRVRAAFAWKKRRKEEKETMSLDQTGVGADATGSSDAFLSVNVRQVEMEEIQG